MSAAQLFLDKLNVDYANLHRNYERLFWISYMGDHSVDEKKNRALFKLDAFRGSKKMLEQTRDQKQLAPKKLQDRLQVWVDFFEQYQTTDEVTVLKKKIDELESDIKRKQSSQKEGYIDPVSGEFVATSLLKMRTYIQTHADEQIRKACFDAKEALALVCIDDYVELVKLRNAFATTLGYEDFYDYKLRHIDKMTKAELFSLFDSIAEKAKAGFVEVRDLAKKTPSLRKPWNFGYLLTGDFTKEEDQYFQFDQAIGRWGQSFAALGITFQGGTMSLDLVDRAGKYSNGFCHWPELVQFKEGKRLAGSANFTCNVVPGQVGSGYQGYVTLFHEGGHAAHFLNVEQKDVCLNHEYAPMTAAWAETHSMFIDTMFSSIEWKERYAKDAEGNAYPFELFARKTRALHVLKARRMLPIILIAEFERAVYELKNPTREQIIALAKKKYLKFTDHSEDSLSALSTPHIYSWESSCSYHGYGLAEIALSQWREYFYKKFGHIVDNPKVGKEMKETWKWGASKSFSECVTIATGKKLSSAALINELQLSPEQTIKRAKTRLTKMRTVKEFKKPVNLNAHIKLVHGKKEIANNKISFETMAQKYGNWLRESARS